MASKPYFERAHRSCGACTACCAAVPVAEIGLRAFSRCGHLRSAPEASLGCGIYDRRPRSCALWSCDWLNEDDWPDELRPDRCGIIVDPVPDLVLMGGVEMPAVQFWVVPGHEEDFEASAAARRLLFSAFDNGYGVLWRIAGNAPGGQLARILWRGENGQLHCSQPAPANGNPLGGIAARSARATELTKSRTR